MYLSYVPPCSEAFKTLAQPAAVVTPPFSDFAQADIYLTHSQQYGFTMGMTFCPFSKKVSRILNRSIDLPAMLSLP